MLTNILMRCGLQSLTRIARSALSIVLMLGAAATHTSAQSPVCHAIRRGESATQAARRVTGNAQNAYREWFQILNPSSRLVPKSQYNRIAFGWRAGVITSAIPLTPAIPLNGHHVEEPAAAEAYEGTSGSRVPAVVAASAALARAEGLAAPAALASAEGLAAPAAPASVEGLAAPVAPASADASDGLQLPVS